MRKLIALILLLTFVLALVGGGNIPNTEEKPNAPVIEEKWALIPMVMVDGVLYLDTGYTNTDIRKCGTPDGEITSEVDRSEKPTVDNQSNFGSGYGYQYGAAEGTIEIYMNDKWRIFATEEVRQQIQFPEKQDTVVVEIRDREKEESIPCDAALEKFYEDESNEYYFSVIKSQYVVVTYNDGSSEDIVTALNAGKVTMADLDKFDIEYHIKPKGTN